MLTIIILKISRISSKENNSTTVSINKIISIVITTKTIKTTITVTVTTKITMAVIITNKSYTYK